MKNGLYNNEPEVMSEADRTGYRHEGANSHCSSSAGSGITSDQEALAKGIARSLHAMSILRHGMFTPVDFEAIVANRIRSFFHSQNTEDRHVAQQSQPTKENQ